MPPWIDLTPPHTSCSSRDHRRDPRSRALGAGSEFVLGAATFVFAFVQTLCSAMRLELHGVTLRSGETAPGWIVTTEPARRHVPAISPSTSSAPGQTRDVHSLARRAESGTSSSRSRPQRRKNVSPLGRRRAGAGAAALARNVDSSLDRIQASPIGVRTGVSESASLSKAARPLAAPIPAQLGEASGVVGPNTWRYRRASSSRASAGATSGAGIVQTAAARALPTDQTACPCGAA